MSKKVKPTEYLDEDHLFLALKLLDYPKMERDKFTFNEMKMEKYKHATASKIFQNIAIFNNQGLLKIEGLIFNMLYANKKESEDIKTLRYITITKNPGHPLSLALKKTIDNNFNFYDLELLYDFGDYIFKFINFDIKINQELRQKFIERLKEYLKLFADGKLESSTENYFRIELQRKNIKGKIDEISGKTGSTLVLRDSNFSNEFRFFENVLLLEKENFLIIKNISSEETNKNSVDYLIHCELKEKNYSCFPFCRIENGDGFLKFNKNGEKIKIGKKDSRHFKLLKLLLKEFGKVNSINHVFEYIKNDKDNKNPDINNSYSGMFPKMQIIENAKKELQKENKMRGKLKIKIEKSMKTIWIEYKNESN